MVGWGWLTTVHSSFQATVLVGLLQPDPETFNLFDDIMLLSEGMSSQALISMHPCSTADASHDNSLIFEPNLSLRCISCVGPGSGALVAVFSAGGELGFPSVAYR